MKITGGEFRNRRVFVPRGYHVRPSSSKLREAVFNILQGEFEEMYFLDLFAGSGVMGLEALSRGAEKATFVEKNPDSLGSIRKNIEYFAVVAEVIPADVLTTLHRFEEGKQQFSVIFADPPYAYSNLARELLFEVGKANLLKEGGHLFIETDEPLSEQTSLHTEKVRQYGKTALNHYRS